MTAPLFPPGTISDLRAAYRAGRLTPREMAADGLLPRLADSAADAIWISRPSDREILARADALGAQGPDRLPLFGIPFAVKDNIDVAGHPTTAGCPGFSYVAEDSAPAVQRLIAAGAIFVGKTNMDQFATGLVGTRSPHGAARNPFDPAYIPGGSSSGSAVAVARGLVPFALGTDTAGSGRVPAAFNNIVGLKPSCGLVSTRGVVPACRTLDCVSIFALTADDAATVLGVIGAFDPDDPFSRPLSRPFARPIADVPPTELADARIAVPRAADREFFGDRAYQAAFDQAVGMLGRLGGQIVEIDYAPFRDAAALLYDGAWLAERYIALAPFLSDHAGEVLPITRAVIERGAEITAAKAFADTYRLAALRRQVDALFDDIDLLLTPTVPTTYRVDQIEADPIARNTRLGTYTNHLNLLDMCAVAVPASMLGNGLPFGVTLSAPAGHEPALIAAARQMQAASGLTLGATGLPLPAPESSLEPALNPALAPSATAPDGNWIELAVIGAHMRNLPLNHELAAAGGRFLCTGHTAPRYRLISLEEADPPRPGMIAARDGAAIALEIWALPTAGLGALLAQVPPPLCIGTVTLADGREIKGFLCEAEAAAHARDITSYGGWRAYLAARESVPAPAIGALDRTAQSQN